MIGGDRKFLPGRWRLFPAVVAYAVSAMISSGSAKASEFLARGEGPHIAEPATALLLPADEARFWRDVQDAVRDGESLDAPDPEPYFSRAELWSRKLANQEEALLDTLRGVEVFLAGEAADDPLTQTIVLMKLRDAAWRSLQKPKTLYGGSAEKHFGEGLHEYRRGNHELAASDFTRAIQLDPLQPHYYYHLALARRQSGDVAAATAYAEKGARLEVHLTDQAKREVSKSLERVQGAERIWLEKLRLGRPTYDPRHDANLPAAFSPAPRTRAEQERIQGAM